MTKREWNQLLKPYSASNNRKAMIQTISTLPTYLFLLAVTSGLFLDGNYGWAIISSVFSGLFMVRVFILFHDCTHGSFFNSKKLNTLWGHIFGVFCFTPFASWKKEHDLHHGSVGNLDRRGVGDIWTLTVEEYQAKSLGVRVIYRIFRNPFFLFTIAPFVKFSILNRLPRAKGKKQEQLSLLIGNLGIFAVHLLFATIFGWRAYLSAQYLSVAVAAASGVWLFYVQHQFEEVYWSQAGDWDSVEAALKGSTFYQLPCFFEWMSGYIGYHHIHHLNSKIPNYELKAAYENIEALQKVKTVNLRESFALAGLHLYDDVKGTMIAFRQLKFRLTKSL